MNIKLVVTDMDGTLLDAQHKVPEKNIQAIFELKKRGIEVVLASGRAHFSVGPHALDLGLTGPQISVNGGLIANAIDNKIHAIHPLSSKDQKYILEILKMKNLKPIVFTKDGMYATVLNEDTELITSYGEPPIQVRTWEELATLFQALKVLIVCERGKMDEELFEFFGADITTIRTGSHFLEFQPKGVSKGRAVEELLAEKGLKNDEIMVFGDNDNDASMLSLSPYSYAMANGTLLAKNAAKFEAPANTDNGFATIINKLLNI